MTHYGVCIELWGWWVVFWYLNIMRNLLVFLPLLYIIFSGGPEHGPSVDCLSTSPKATLGNEHKQKTATSTVYLSMCFYSKCVTGEGCGSLTSVFCTWVTLKHQNLFYDFSYMLYSTKEIRFSQQCSGFMYVILADLESLNAPSNVDQ